MEARRELIPASASLSPAAAAAASDVWRAFPRTKVFCPLAACLLILPGSSPNWKRKCED